MSKRCKCSPQSFDTLQFFDVKGEHRIIYCTKCKSPNKKKIDHSKRKVNKSKHNDIIKKQQELVSKSAKEVRELFNKKGGRVAESKQQKQLISQINDLMFYQEIASV